MKFSERMAMAHMLLTLLDRQISDTERDKWGQELIERMSEALDWDQGWDALVEDMQEVVAWILNSYPAIHRK